MAGKRWAEARKKEVPIRKHPDAELHREFREGAGGYFWPRIMTFEDALVVEPFEALKLDAPSIRQSYCGNSSVLVYSSWLAEREG